ncbi:hypothetical protein B0O80DRAFT_423825 [Mortierella sp. GBAus27b]|nr:hypothetical protein B0O80DRAFT_423825 [Mortierella sp. GBAus27b]
MSRFYKPMNPSYIPLQTTTAAPASTPYSLAQQQPTPAPSMPGNAQDSTTAPGSTIGPSAALLLASLASTPGFLSDQAIQQAREQYSQHQANVPVASHTQGYQPTVHGYQYAPTAATSYTPSLPHQGSVSHQSTDPSASIEALLKELHQTGTPNAPSPLSFTPQTSTTASSYTPETSAPQPPVAAPLPPKQPSPSPQEAEDFKDGKITRQLLKKVVAIAEADSQGGGILLNEIKRLRERQIKAEHGQELKKFDKHVIRTLDKEIRNVQETLSKAGVPVMSSTTDPAMVASQIKVLRLLEETLQT